jgi:ribosome-associated protein
MIRVTDAIVLDDREIKESFVRATGPGGQNVNKVATAVELRFDIGRSSLPRDVKERVTALAGRRLTSDGVLVVVSRVHRSQVQNREAARARLVTILKRAVKPPTKRTPTRPSAAARERRLVAKQRQSAVKRTRSRPDDE